MRSASVGSGAMAKTSCIACSCSMPVARPDGVALDAAAVGVGRRVGDAGDLERAAVHPHAVVVAVRQRHGPVRHDGVELLAGGEAAREVAHVPAAAEHPVAVGMLRGVRADRRHGLRAPGDVVEVALRHAVAGHRRVAVGVEEAGQQHAALQVDRARRRAALGIDLDDCRRRRRCGRPRRPPPRPAGGRRCRCGRRRSGGSGLRAQRQILPAGHQIRRPSMPPATVTTWPLRCPAAVSDERKTIDAAQSSGVATLRSG